MIAWVLFLGMLQLQGKPMIEANHWPCTVTYVDKTGNEHCTDTITFCYGDGGHQVPCPSPMDAPAVWWEVSTMRECWLPGKFEALFGPTKAWCEKRGGWSYKPNYSGWKCEDPSRVLLTAGDGTAHCIKFPKDHP